MSDRQIDRDRFLEEGYLVVRGVIPPGDLDAVREAYERLVDVQRGIWRETRAEGDPPGGMWETHRQPRLHLSRRPLSQRIDRSTARAVEMWLSEGAHGVSSALLDLPDASVTEMMMMCNPVRDHGPAEWHRDMYPPIAAPLRNYNEDILENGPRYVQWNISLYADDVLWVVPGSHVRLNTAEENTQLRADPRVPLPHAVQTHLQPGDGVVYILPILHWGSAYLARQRRCIHGGFARYAQDRDQSFLPHLSPAAREAFERWTGRTDRAFERTEAALRAAMAGDVAAYRTALDGIHPGRGPQRQMLFSIYLSKQAKYVLGSKRPDAVCWTDKERNYAADAHPMTLHWGQRMADRFTTEEAERMFGAFEPLDTSLQADTEQHMPGFQGAASTYRFDELPDFTLGDLYRSWRAA